MTVDQVTPPPLPHTETVAEWFHVKNGTRQGPVTVASIKSLLEQRDIEADTQIWRHGMTEWTTIRNSELSYLVATEPPPISSTHIGNGYVWALAILPLILSFIDAAIEVSNQDAAARTLSLGFPYNPSRGIPPQLIFIINGLLGWFDYRQLDKAGYGAWTTRACAVLLPPIYLFIRAKRLKQRPSYAIAWLASFVLGVVIYGSAAT